MLGWLAQKRLILERLKSTFWFSFSAKIKFRTHSCQKSKKNKIEQRTKIFIYRDLKLLFKFISPVHIISRRRPIRICYMKGKIFKIKNAMVTFISIEYSEPKILTRNLHHHSPSYLAVLFCLREKLTRHVPLLDSKVNFAEQYSSLIVW